MSKTNHSAQEVPVITINGQRTKLYLGTNQIPKLERFQISMTESNVSEKGTETTQTSQKGSSSARIKLRDYLFQAQVSANKNAMKNRKALQNVVNQANTVQSQDSKAASKSSTVGAKKSLYSITNSEMFAVLKQQIRVQVEESFKQLQAFNCQFNQQTRQCTKPSNQQMMMMYDLRRLLQDNMNGCLKQMREILAKENTHRDGNEEMQLVMDQQQLRGEMGNTQRVFSRKEGYLEHKANLK